jgi:hypothetical protein
MQPMTGLILTDSDSHQWVGSLSDSDRLSSRRRYAYLRHTTPVCHGGGASIGWTLRGVLDAQPIDTLAAQLSTPLPLVPTPPPEYGGLYPEDREHDDDEMALIDSSLSVIAWIADEAPGVVGDWSGDEDEGVDGFGREGSSFPTHFLESFDSQFATSTWTRWDGDSTV